MDVLGSTINKELNRSVIVSGTAKEGIPGPPLGLFDIGINEKAYLFQVALPGVRKDQGNVEVEIEKGGKVKIHGVVPSGELMQDVGEGYKVKVQQLCPPGHFTVYFNLPGPVDPRFCSPNFRSDGILEVVVMRRDSKVGKTTS